MTNTKINILKIFITIILCLAIIVFFTILIRHRIDNLHKDKTPLKEKQAIGPLVEYKLQVKEIQQILKNAGFDPGPVDGIMGNRTRQAIRKFQEAKGLQSTGKIDEETMLALNKEKGEIETTILQIDEQKTAKPIKETNEIQSETETMSSKLNDRTKQIQIALKQTEFYEGPIDGKMNEQTKQAIKSFQKSKGLTADGIVGPKTWEELSKQFK